MPRTGSDKVSAPCSRCGTTTTHRPDDAGRLHCVACMIEDSMNPNPASDTPTPLGIPRVPPAVEDEPKRRSPGEIVAAVATVLIVGFLIYAFVRGH